MTPRLHPPRDRPPAAIAGALCARSEAHPIPLALLYALAHDERNIKTVTSKPLALWDYTARSATRALTGDPLAEEIHAALQHHPAGLARGRISDMLQHNRPANQLQQALGALQLAGRATRAHIPTAGRPAELWTATTPAA